MTSKNNLDLQIENLVDLNSIVTTYEEIAAGRIKQSRESVLRNRIFTNEINSVFYDVITSYKAQVEALMRQKKAKYLKNFSFMNKNGKTLYLLISANTGFYGSITRRTFDLFAKNVQGKNVDKAIIGKLGQTLWQEEKNKNNYYYFDFPDQSVDKNQLKKVLDFIVPYKEVVVFYGKFQTLVTQEPVFTDISGTSAPLQQSGTTTHQKYLFEPSLEKILEFFEKQIFASIFEQVMRESQLAKISSRMTTLNTATENIKGQLTSLTLQRNRIYHQMQNKKQLQTFSSRIIWRQN